MKNLQAYVHQASSLIRTYILQSVYRSYLLYPSSKCHKIWERLFFLRKIVGIWFWVWFKFMWKYSISWPKSALLGPNFEKQQKVRFWFVSALCVRVCDLDNVFSMTIWLHLKRELMLRCIKIIEFFMSEHTVWAQNGGLSFPLEFFSVVRIDAKIVWSC